VTSLRCGLLRRLGGGIARLELAGGGGRVGAVLRGPGVHRRPPAIATTNTDGVDDDDDDDDDEGDAAEQQRQTWNEPAGRRASDTLG